MHRKCKVSEIIIYQFKWCFRHQTSQGTSKKEACFPICEERSLLVECTIFYMFLEPTVQLSWHKQISLLLACIYYDLKMFLIASLASYTCAIRHIYLAPAHKRRHMQGNFLRTHLLNLKGKVHPRTGKKAQMGGGGRLIALPFL